MAPPPSRTCCLSLRGGAIMAECNLRVGRRHQRQPRGVLAICCCNLGLPLSDAQHTQPTWQRRLHARWRKDGGGGVSRGVPARAQSSGVAALRPAAATHRQQLDAYQVLHAAQRHSTPLLRALAAPTAAAAAAGRGAGAWLQLQALVDDGGQQAVTPCVHAGVGRWCLLGGIERRGRGQHGGRAAGPAACASASARVARQRAHAPVSSTCRAEDTSKRGMRRSSSSAWMRHSSSAACCSDAAWSCAFRSTSL